MNIRILTALAALVCMAVPFSAEAQRVKDRHKHGVLIQGKMDVSVSGATVDVLPELVALDGVTATSTELNLIDGYTGTTAQLNFLAAVTAGTAAASKALVLDSSGQINTIDIASGGCLKLNGNKTNCLATADVTSAELLALNATPITILAAPGSGLANIVHRICVQLDYNSTAYDGIAAGENLEFLYTDASGAAVTADMETATFLAGTGDLTYCVFSNFVDKDAVEDFAPLANAVVVIHLQTAEIANGNSPLDVEVLYSTVILEIP